MEDLESLLENVSLKGAKFTFQNQDAPKNILVIGKTGSGKSSFVETVIEKDLGIVGHSANSCTTQIQIFKRENLTLIDSPGLDDEYGRDQEFLDQLHDKLQPLLPIHGVILLIEATARISGSLKETLQYYKILLNCQKGHKIALCMTKTRDLGQASALKEGIRQKNLFDCELEHFCWVKGDNDDELKDILAAALESKPFEGLTYVQTIMKKLSTYENERKDLLEREKKLSQLVEQQKIERAAYEQEISNISQQKERIRQAYIEVKSQQSQGSIYGVGDRCGRPTRSGTPCKNSSNCYYARIGKH